MAYKIFSYLGLIGVLIISSVQGAKITDCGLWVVNQKIQLRCDCDEGEIPNGWICRPTDASCPNGYFDIFENRCKCIKYSRDGDTNSQCENLCHDNCDNGVCLASGKCSCNEGYSMSKFNKCEPVCKSGCEHGFCKAPEQCQCNEGYELGYGNICKPICEYGCENGFCLHPNWCSCNDGYARSGPNECKIICNGYDIVVNCVETV